MWNELQALAKTSPNFILNRWDNPLHADVPTDTQGNLWPSSDEFYHPLNPVFSFFFQRLENLGLFKVLTVRDGAQGLLNFFHRFPLPKTVTTQLLVPAELLFLVPDAWRPKVLCYRLEANKPRPVTSKYLMYGLISDVFLSWNRFRHHAEDWVKQFDPNADVSAYFASRNELFDQTWTDRRTGFELTAILQSYFKKRIQFLTWPEVQNIGPQSDTTLVHLDQWHNAVSLCGVDSIMLGKGLPLWGRGVYGGFTGKKIGRWPISFQHSIAVYTAECEHSDFTHFFFLKKTSPNQAQQLPSPIKPELMELLSQRLKVKGLNA